MGIRMDQHMGFNPWATNFLEELKELVYTEEVTRVYPDGRRETLDPIPIHKHYEVIESGSYSGMFDNEYPLHKYTTSGGRIYFEALQASPWSSGPVFFLALKYNNGKWLDESLWSEQEIEEA